MSTPHPLTRSQFGRAIIHEAETFALRERIEVLCMKSAGYRYAWICNLLSLLCGSAAAWIYAQKLHFFWLGVAVTGAVIWLVAGFLFVWMGTTYKAACDAEEESENEGQTQDA